MKALIVLILFSKFAYADSFTDLTYEVAAASGEPVGVTRRVMVQLFKKIEDRMKEDRATSIPEFARFYTQEKEKKSQKDKEGYWLSPKIVRVPKCSIAKQLRERLEKVE